jgi:hypothetical protein
MTAKQYSPRSEPNAPLFSRVVLPRLEKLQLVRVGDLVERNYTEAIAVSVESASR